MIMIIWTVCAIALNLTSHSFDFVYFVLFRFKIVTVCRSTKKRVSLLIGHIFIGTIHLKIVWFWELGKSVVTVMSIVIQNQVRHASTKYWSIYFITKRTICWIFTFVLFLQRQWEQKCLSCFIINKRILFRRVPFIWSESPDDFIKLSFHNH